MPEPTSSALGAFAAAGSGLTMLATAMGVPSSIVMAAILGATAGVSMFGKIDWNFRSLATALSVWCASVGLGIWGGGAAGHTLVGLINGLVPKAALPTDITDPVCTLLLAMIGLSQLLPIGLSLLRSKAGATQ